MSVPACPAFQKVELFLLAHVENLPSKRLHGAGWPVAHGRYSGTLKNLPLMQERHSERVKRMRFVTGWLVQRSTPA